jgi:hypothetical protein
LCHADFHGSQDGSSAASSVVVGGEGGGTGSIRVPPPASVEDDDPFAEMDDSDHSPPKGPPKAPLLKLPLVRTHRPMMEGAQIMFPMCVRRSGVG